MRILEYYSGILFLTTNRVGAIDDAFRSRLRLTFYYPKLTKRQTKEIFKRNFQRIAEINVVREKNNLVPFEYKESEARIMDWPWESWKMLRWNGRQIRNAFQTVLALVEFHHKKRSSELAKPVELKKHFKIVANASIQFDEYLLAIHGVDEDKGAQREYMRAQNYSPPSDLIFKGFSQKDFDSSSDEEDSSNDSETDIESDDSDESGGGKKKSLAREGREPSRRAGARGARRHLTKRGNQKRSTKRRRRERKEGWGGRRWLIAVWFLGRPVVACNYRYEIRPKAAWKFTNKPPSKST